MNQTTETKGPNTALNELLVEAHDTFVQLSIETKLVKLGDSDDYWAGMAAYVKTPKGTYSAWAMGDAEEIEALEEAALLKALHRAGLGLTPPPVSSPYSPYFDFTVPPLVVEQVSQPGKQEKQESAPSIFRAATTLDSTIEDAGDSAVSAQPCEKCGKAIEDYWAGSSVMTAQELAEKSRDRYGIALCASCLVRQATRGRGRPRKGT